jgi:sterol desaturase/sphingolipid hydroxylase (fatty acid hydroxylase superfamily)
MMAIEAGRPGRNWAAVSGWWGRAALLNSVQVLAVFVAGLTWDKWFPGHALWNGGQQMGTLGGAAFGYFVITFIYYWWHRWRHEVPFLWRHLHQVHHSAQRIEIITAFYKHPLEIMINSVLSSAILYLLCGLTPEAASLAVLLTGLGELVYHWNVKTPYWLGFIFQRPESHCVHHQQRHHTQNFSDLPLWDMLFGTFNNPRVFDKACGFTADRELQLKEMLLGKDVHRKQA